MTLADYEALTMGWREVHDQSDDDVDAPEVDRVRRNMERLKNTPEIIA